MNPYKIGTMRTFKTKNFTVVAEALEETIIVQVERGSNEQI